MISGISKKTKSSLAIIAILIVAGAGIYAFSVLKQTKEEKTIAKQHAILDTLGAQSATIKVLTPEQSWKLLNK